MRSPLAVVGLAWLVASSAAAQELSVELRAPDALHQGDRAEVVALVRGAGAHPLLVTPSSEGTALEVVRGRLLRAEATDPQADTLEFHIPIVANGPGAAVIRVEAAGYACERRCRSVRAEASLVVHVAPALPGSGTARKQDEAQRERTSSLSWVRLPGAEACISSTQLARAVEERLARRVFVSAAEADLAVEGRAERADAGWRAVLQVSEPDGTMIGERTLASDEASCDALGRLVALTVALMIDPLTAPPPEASTDDAPQEDDDADDEPVERVVVRTVEVPVPVPVEPAPQPRWRVEIDSAVLGALGLLPTPALGGLASVIVEPPGFIPIVFEGALVPFSRAEANGGPHADFLQVHAGVQLCPLALRERGLALHGCLGADAGGMFVIGSDVPLDERERVIGQAHVALRGHWDVIGPLTIRLGLHLLVPFRHEAFTYGGGANALYVPEYVAGMLDLGAGVHFD